LPMNTGSGESDMLMPTSAVSIMKSAALVFVPPGAATVIFPVVASFGTTAVRVVLLITVKLAGRPLNKTAVALVKLVPVTVTFVPDKPCVGVKPVMVGGA